MTLLATLTDADLGFPYTFPATYDTRTAVRALVRDDAGNIALAHNGKTNVWKIPGGGVEAGESLEQTLHREIREEAGCKIQNLVYLGFLEERRGQGLKGTEHGFLQVSHLFTANLLGNKGEPEFDSGEQANNFSLHWLPIAEAMRLTAATPPNPDYASTFQIARERKLLELLPK